MLMCFNKSISDGFTSSLIYNWYYAACHRITEYVEGATRRYSTVIVWESNIVIFIQTAFGVTLVIILLPSVRYFDLIILRFRAYIDIIYFQASTHIYTGTSCRCTHTCIILQFFPTKSCYLHFKSYAYKQINFNTSLLSISYGLLFRWSKFSLSGKHPYHKYCFKELSHPKCEVCHHYVSCSSPSFDFSRCPTWLLVFFNS